MIAVERSLGRLVVVTASHPVTKLDALRFQQDASALLRRLGEPALVLADFRDVPGMDPEVSRVVALMLSSATSLARRRVVLGAAPGTFAGEFAANHDGWHAVADSGELASALAGVGTPAEQHAAHQAFAQRLAA